MSRLGSWLSKAISVCQVPFLAGMRAMGEIRTTFSAEVLRRQTFQSTPNDPFSFFNEHSSQRARAYLRVWFLCGLCDNCSLIAELGSVAFPQEQDYVLPFWEHNCWQPGQGKRTHGDYVRKGNELTQWVLELAIRRAIFFFRVTQTFKATKRVEGLERKIWNVYWLNCSSGLEADFPWQWAATVLLHGQVKQVYACSWFDNLGFPCILVFLEPNICASV